MDYENEIWRDTGILGTMVSNYGRVKRKSDDFIYKTDKVQKNGYRYVALSYKNKTIMKKIARLVAIAFIPNPQNKPQVDHINTIRTDDRVENLRWVTRSENMRNPITLKKMSRSQSKKRPHREKPILQFTRDGVFLREWSSATAFGEYIGKDVSGNIIACIKGKQPTAYGYKWKYKNT